MELPVYIDGERSGVMTVTETADGALVSARLRDPGRVVRLTVYGKGEMYLGIPEPAGGMLLLERRLDAGQAQLLPRNLAYAAESRREDTRSYRHVLWQGGKPHYF